MTDACRDARTAGMISTTFYLMLTLTLTLTLALAVLNVLLVLMRQLHVTIQIYNGR